MAAATRKSSGLRRKWMINSIVPVVVILILFSVIICIFFVSSYYNSAVSTLENKARTGIDYFEKSNLTSYEEFYLSATNYAQSFENAGQIEIQFLSTNGRVEISSRGLMVGQKPGTPEITRALQNGEITNYRGQSPTTGEPILAVSSIIKQNGSVIGVIRLVTASRNLTNQVMMTLIIILVITLALIGLIIMSSLLFINNVVAPVSAVSEAAKEISSGTYGVQIPNTYDDEMAELVDNINDMSIKIGQNEKMRSEFVSSVSHELRTPLTAINGWAETLINGETSDVEAMQRGLSIISKESSRLTKMVEELLDFSRMENGRFTLSLDEIDLQAEFEDAVYTYQGLYAKEGITLEYSSEKDIYTETTMADSERLKQVFCNLLDNAKKHGGAGKKISCGFKQEGKKYVITVRDYGQGIPEEELPFVKQKFYKGSSKARGNGIGLAVCDEIIRMHEGTLDITNAKGGGAIVTIKLPIKKHSKKNGTKIANKD